MGPPGVGAASVQVGVQNNVCVSPYRDMTPEQVKAIMEEKIRDFKT